MEKEEAEPVGMEDVPPVTELQGFEFPAEPEFTDGVRRRIDRRETASGLVDLSFRGFFILLREYFSILFEVVFAPSDSDQEDEDKEP